MAYPTVSSYTKKYVRARAEAHMNVDIVVYSRSETELDVTTGMVKAIYGDPIYTGKARIWSIDSAGAISVGDAQFATRQTFCSIPWNSPVPPLDSVVEIVDTPEGEFYEETTWRVIGVDDGGLMRAARRLQISTWGANAYWEE